MPFDKAAEMLTRFTQVPISASPTQRHTEAIGRAYQAVQLAEVEVIEQGLGCAARPSQAPAQCGWRVLKHAGSTDLMATLRNFAAEQLTDERVVQNPTYLEKRVGQMAYPRFQAEG